MCQQDIAQPIHVWGAMTGMKGWFACWIGGIGISSEIVIKRNIFLENNYDMFDRGSCGRDSAGVYSSSGCFSSWKLLRACSRENLHTKHKHQRYKERGSFLPVFLHITSFLFLKHTIKNDLCKLYPLFY